MEDAALTSCLRDGFTEQGCLATPVKLNCEQVISPCARILCAVWITRQSPLQLLLANLGNRSQLSFSSHVINLTRYSRFILCNIRTIPPFLSTQATHLLVQSLLILSVNYRNLLLVGLPLIWPQFVLRRWSRMQMHDLFLKFVNLLKFSHTILLLRSLKWLPVAAPSDLNHWWLPTKPKLKQHPLIPQDISQWLRWW